MRAPGSDKGIAAGDVLLAVDGVSLAFGGVKAITDVSFDIRKGEIRAIIGPNGAGKTSMLNVINGFYHPQHGRITFKGQTRQRMRPSIRKAHYMDCPHCAGLGEIRMPDSVASDAMRRIQLAFDTPGSSPRLTVSRIFTRDRPNLRYTPRGRPVMAQRNRPRLGLASRGIF